MNSKISLRHFLFLIIILFNINKSTAQEKSFIREYLYKASETDSKVSSRQKALTEVKALLIEELGTYVESYVNYIVEEENGVISKDFFTNEINTLSTGTTETKILEERWDGYEYYVKAEITADPEEVVTRINQTLSIRKSSAAIDSLKILLSSSKNEITLKNEELSAIKDSLSFQQKRIDSTQVYLNSLNQQLLESKRQLTSFQASENRIRTEIEEIEQKIKKSTNKAIANVRIGMTPNEVIQVCGTSRSLDFDNLNYGSVWVIIQSGIVVGVVDARDYFGPAGMDYYKSKGAKIILK
jgi:chromosome segregation ATPase